MKIASACFIVFAGLAGCTDTSFNCKSGGEISAQKMSQFEPGKTTQNQIISEIGQPNKKTVIDSKEVWYYDYNKIGVFFNGNVSETAVFEWNSAGKLLQAYKTYKAGD